MDMPKYRILPPSTMLNPTPVVLVSCAEKGQPENRNMITLAWAGTVNSEPPMVSISVRKSRYSHELIRQSGEFVVNLTDEQMARAVDYCGVKSGEYPVRLGRGAMTAMRHSVYADLKKLFAFSLQEESLQQFSQAAEAFTLSKIEKNLTTLAFLHTMM